MGDRRRRHQLRARHAATRSRPRSCGTTALGQPGAGGGGLSTPVHAPVLPERHGRPATSARCRMSSMLADVVAWLRHLLLGGGRLHQPEQTNPWQTVGGTSAATPLLAGGFALIDQHLRRPRAAGARASPTRCSTSSAQPGQRRTVFYDVTDGLQRRRAVHQADGAAARLLHRRARLRRGLGLGRCQPRRAARRRCPASRRSSTSALSLPPRPARRTPACRPRSRAQALPVRRVRRRAIGRGAVDRHRAYVLRPPTARRCAPVSGPRRGASPGPAHLATVEDVSSTQAGPGDGAALTGDRSSAGANIDVCRSPPALSAPIAATGTSPMLGGPLESAA